MRKRGRNAPLYNVLIENEFFRIAFMDDHVEIKDLVEGKIVRLHSMTSIMRADFFKARRALRADVLDTAFQYCPQIKD